MAQPALKPEKPATVKLRFAKAACHDLRIQEEFHDSPCESISAGSRATSRRKWSTLIETLAGERPGSADLPVAGARLGEVLGDRDILLVIDDVLNRAHAEF